MVTDALCKVMRLINYYYGVLYPFIYLFKKYISYSRNHNMEIISNYYVGCCSNLYHPFIRAGKLALANFNQFFMRFYTSVIVQSFIKKCICLCLTQLVITARISIKQTFFIFSFLFTALIEPFMV